MGNRFTPGCRCCDPCTFFRDEFTRADSTDLDDNWDEVSGTWEIVDQQLVCSAPGIVRLVDFVPQVWEMSIKANDGDVIRLGNFTDPDTLLYIELEFGAAARVAVYDHLNFPTDPLRQECGITLPADQFVTLRSVGGILLIDDTVVINPVVSGYEGHANQIEVVSQSDDVFIDYFKGEYAYEETEHPECEQRTLCRWLRAVNHDDLPATVTVTISDGFDVDDPFSPGAYFRNYGSNLNGVYVLDKAETPECGYILDGLNILIRDRRLVADDSLDPGSELYVTAIRFVPGDRNVVCVSFDNVLLLPVTYATNDDTGSACETMLANSLAAATDGRYGTAEITQ
jgi:hypothetical protein